MGQPFRFLLASLKLLAFFLILTLLLFIGVTIKLLPLNLRVKRLAIVYVTSLLSRFCLWGIGVKLIVRGKNLAERNYLICANHMGMLDVLAINCHCPSLFVTSQELRETPIVGWITEAAGCIFVERRSRLNIQNEVRQITQALRQGVNVCFFPEARSTDGSQVLPFKKSLFVAAADSVRPILPITINYLSLDGVPVTSQNRDYICWYGDQSFLGALWRVLMNLRIEIELIFHQDFLIQSVEDRTFAAQKAHDLITGSFIPII